VPRVVSFIVLVGILAIIGAIFFKVMAQFVLPLFLAAVLVVVFKPLHMRVRELFPGRLRISALVTTTLIMLVVLLPTSWLAWNAYQEGRAVFNYLKNKENQNRLVAKLEKAAGPILELYDSMGGAATPEAPDNARMPSDATGDPIFEVPPVDAAVREGTAPPSPSAPPTALRVLFNNAASAIGGFLLDIVQGLVRLIIGLIILVLALYYFLVDGPSMIHTMMRLSPLDNEYEQELLNKFANVSRAVVLAVLAAAVVQGLLAGVAFYFALNPGAPIILLTTMTMVLAVVPFVGAAGLWIPTSLWIFFYQEHLVDGVVVQGDPVKAIGLAIYCACVVSTIDNVIKPLVLHGQSNIHPLLALMSVLGGIKALGPAGILIGPMVVAFIHALLIMVNKELRLLGRPEAGDGERQKRLFPLHPALELEAEAAAHDSPGGVVDQIVSTAAGIAPGTDESKAESKGLPARRPGPIARVRSAAKRRRRRK
jgi:predicted PurR-regulated permease PerM